MNDAHADAYALHSQAAADLLKTRTAYYNGGQTVVDEPPTDRAVARAQAHATLALAAATIAGTVAEIRTVCSRPPGSVDDPCAHCGRPKAAHEQAWSA